MADARPTSRPVNLITGFLGSGKTTLLQRLLADPALADTAVLINEFGEVGLDHHLLERIDETMVLLQSGCLCCTIRGELADGDQGPAFAARARAGAALPSAGRRKHRPGRSVPDPVDGAGRSRAAAPFPPRQRHHHGRCGERRGQLDRQPESIKQVAVADRLVLTKTDLADATTVDGADRAAAPAQSRCAAVARGGRRARRRGAARTICSRRRAAKPARRRFAAE